MLIVTGLFLKVVIANHLATHIVDEVFAAPNRHSSLEVLVAVYAYAVQIYCRLLRLHEHRDRHRVAARFRVPAELPLAVRRSHAAGLLAALAHHALHAGCATTCTSRSAGTAAARCVTYRNVMLTMLLGGLWHGAAWTFVVWGAIHGIGLCVERALHWQPTSKAARWFGRILTFQIVCFAWIFFRADSFARGPGR